MVTVAIVLNTAKKLTNNEYPVVLRVTHKYKRKYYSINSLLTDQTLKFRCTREHWRASHSEDNGLGKFLKSFRLYKEYNEILETKLAYANTVIKRYDNDGIAFSFEQFENDLKHKERPSITLLQDYYTLQISVLDEQGRVGQSGLNYEVQRILKMFRPNALLTDVNVRFLESFEYWLRNERKNKDTTISVKMRNLQRILNQAIEDKLLKQEAYPFGEKKYSVNKRLDNKTKKIAITLDKVGKLKQLTLKPGTALHLAQQMFMFSYYSRGMNFIDMTYLKWKDISETHIYYVRKKTRGQFEIPLNEHNSAILKYFRDSYIIEGGFVFPILDPKIHITLKPLF